MRSMLAVLAGMSLATAAVAAPGQSELPRSMAPASPSVSPLDQAERLVIEGRAVEAEPILVDQLFAAPNGTDDAVRARLLLAQARIALGRAAEAEAPASEALAATDAAHPWRGWALGVNVDVLTALDRPVEALVLMEEDLALSRRLGLDAEIRALARMGAAQLQAGRYREASERLSDAIQAMESGRLPDAPLRLAALSQLGRSLDLQGRHGEARPHLEAAYDLAVATDGADSLAAAQALNDLGTHFNDTGDYALADESLRRALALYELLTGPGSQQTGAALTNLGNVHMNAGRWAAAEPYHRRALAISRDRGTDVDEAIDLTNLGWVLHKQGHEAEAETLLARSVALFEGSFGPDHPYTATARTNLAGALRVQGRCREAAPMFREVARVYAATLEDDNPVWPFTLNGLAACLAETGGDPAEIESLFTRALAVSWSVLSPGHPYGLEPANDYAAWLISQGRAQEASELLDRAGRALLERTVARAGSDRTAQGELSQFRTLFQLRVDAAWALAQAAP